MKRNNRGLTLIEVLIASVVLLFITAAIYALIWRGGLTYTTVSKTATLQRNAQVVLERIAEELRIANPDTMTPGKGLSATSMVFQCSTGFGQLTDPITKLPMVDAAGEPLLGTLWGTNVEYAYEDSDVDANENGLADDGRLVRVKDGQNIRLCDYVKQGGFTITRKDNQVTISLTLLVSEDGKHMLSTTVTTSVIIRNRSTL